MNRNEMLNWGAKHLGMLTQEELVTLGESVHKTRLLSVFANSDKKSLFWIEIVESLARSMGDIATRIQCEQSVEQYLPWLIEQGYVVKGSNGYSLTPQGLQRVRASELF